MLKKNLVLTKKKILPIIIACGILGMAFMVLINVKAEKAREQASISYSTPAAGMSAVMRGYLDSAGDSSIDFLATTVVSSGLGGNMYYNKNGSTIGKLIVCTAEEYSPVYLIKDSTSGMYGKIYKNSVATLISIDGEWCKIVSGVVSGFVHTKDFAFGKEAEALDALTYVTTATVNSDELTLREEESMTATALCILAPDSVHEVIDWEPGAQWTRINVSGVGEGYVLSEYISIDTKRKTGTTIDEQYMTRSQISMGVSEAESREAQWLAERIAAEEAERERLEALESENYYDEENDTYYYYDEESDNYFYYDEEEDEYYQYDSGYEEYYEEYDDYGYEDDSYDDYGYYEEDTYYEDTYYDDSAWSIRQQLVEYARSFVGWLPYVSGGASLVYGADCSGFTSQIYAAFGYTIPRGSDAQSYCGRSVPLSEIQPGDIIVYAGHVAIYSGNGCKIHSPYPGQVVTENSMYYMTILDVRRVIE